MSTNYLECLAIGYICSMVVGCYNYWLDIWFLVLPKCLNISLFTGCGFGGFVASLNKHMPYKCTMIVDLLYTNCHECDGCAFIIYM
jgi:hypothetical protein